MMNCCQVLRINGLVTHESGCPDNWKGLTKACFECGQGFTLLKSRFERVCGDCIESETIYDADYMDLGQPESEGGGF